MNKRGGTRTPPFFFSRARELKPYWCMKKIKGEILSIKLFYRDVKEGCFTDEDGQGFYAVKGKSTGIPIKPSDILKGSWRREFQQVIWYDGKY